MEKTEKGKLSTTLLTQTEKQEGPRHLEDDGENTPSVWGKGGESFKPSQASEGSTAVSHSCSVDLATGKHTS